MFVAWEAGCLEKNYLRKWLCDTSHELERLEQDAAPSGWLCQWDRYSIPSKICVLFHINKHESYQDIQDIMYVIHVIILKIFKSYNFRTYRYSEILNGENE